MMNDIKITIIVPAYNVEKWIERCICSIINQTYKNLEIIIINDGSTDSTADMINYYAEMDSRIVAVHQENSGPNEVRERGINMATGQYVGFVDGDDEIENNMLERLLNNAIKYSADISQCGILYCFYDGRRKPLYGTGDIMVFDKENGYRELMAGSRMEPSLCNKIYKKDLLINSCPDKSVINNEDLLMNAVIFERAEKSVFEDFCGYHYWRRAESVSNNNRTVANVKHVLKARKTIMDIAPDNLWKYSFECYINGLIGSYNSLVGDNAPEAVALKRECKNNLKKYRDKYSLLSKKTCCKIFAIENCSWIYDIVRVIHTKRIYAKIRKSVKKLNKQSRGTPWKKFL